jgi:hypothetical protein
MPPELQKLLDELDAADRDAKAVADGSTNSEARGVRPRAPGAWPSVFDHLAVSNRVYLVRQCGGSGRGRAQGRMRRKPALPGIIGGWFARYLEPPVSVKTKNPRITTPRASPPLDDSLTAFLESQAGVHDFIRANADLDLAGIRFVNPFIRGVRFSLATVLHVIAAHDRGICGRPGTFDGRVPSESQEDTSQRAGACDRRGLRRGPRGHCGGAAPAWLVAQSKAAATWKRGIEGQRQADLGNGQYLNPILAGDRPDPSVVRDGSDYYMVHSSFENYPGLLVWRSRDLVNWALWDPHSPPTSASSGRLTSSSTTAASTSTSRKTR